MSSLGWSDEIQEVIFMASYTKSISCWDQSGSYYTVLGGKVYYAVATSTSSSPSAPSLSTSSSSVSVSSNSTVYTSKVTSTGSVPYAWPTTAGTYFTYAARYYNSQGKWGTEGPITWGGYVKKLKISVILVITISKTFSTSMKITTITYANIKNITIASTVDNEAISAGPYNVGPTKANVGSGTKYIVSADFIIRYTDEFYIDKTYSVIVSEIVIYGVTSSTGSPSAISTSPVSSTKFTADASTNQIYINLN